MKNKLILSLIVSIIIILPVGFGYYLSVDLAWGPHLPLQHPSSNTWLLYNLIDALPERLSGFVEKIVLTITCVIASLGAVMMLSLRGRTRFHDHTVYIAASLYVFNPFVYTRLLAGQWLVLLGYALLPWFIAATWKFLNGPRLKTAWPVLAWLTAIGFTSIHTLGFAALVTVVMFFFMFKLQLKRKLAWGAAIVGAWVALNLVWLIPFLTGSSSAGQAVEQFGGSQLEAFATTGTVLGSPVLSAIFLTGFWADPLGRYTLPSDFGVPWFIAATLIVGLAITGAVFVFRRKDKLGMALAVSGVIALVLAVGIASPLTEWLTRLLHAYVPLYAGYREPHKWLALLAVAYAYLEAVGLGVIIKALKQKGRAAFVLPVMLVALSLPIIFTPNLAWGAGGQLKSVDYPAGWQQAKTYLANEPGNTKILVLPWHMYLKVGFVGRVVANPAPYYFDQTMIVSDNAELKGVPVQNADAIHTYVNDVLLPQRFTVTDAGKKLGELGISYVMVLKEADYASYGWLDRRDGLRDVFNNDSLILYKVAR